MPDRAANAIGIIGTGEIGWRMGRLLLAAGHEVIGFDRSQAALQRAQQSGFALADSIADLCRRAELVITCVTDGTSLREVVLGPEGVAHNLPAGTPLIDTTSAEPWISQQLAPALQRAGIPFLDAPVSGGVPAAEAGRMNFMVGGDARILDQVRPILAPLGPVITHVGGTGSGHTIKAINMLALASSMLSTAELLAIAVSAGQSLERVVAHLNAGPAASYSTRVHFPRFVVPGSYASGFTFDLMLKDLAIGAGLAERCDVPLFVQRACYEFYRAAANAGHRGKDNTRIVEPLLGRAAATANKLDGEAVQRLQTIAAACNLAVAAESICLGAAAGLPPAIVIEVLAASSGHSHALASQLPAYLRGTADESGATLGKIWQAASAVVTDAMAARIPTPLVSQTTAIYAAAITRYGAQADGRRVVDLIAEWTGQNRRLATAGAQA